MDSINDFNDFEILFGNLSIHSNYSSISSDVYHWIEDIDIDIEEYEEHTNGINIIDLNEYCILHLLSFISFGQLMTLRTVCKQFKHYIELYLRTKRRLKLINSFANKNINIETTKTDERDLTIIAIDSNCDHILQLSTKLCPNFDSLEFIYVTIDDSMVEILIKNFYDVNQLCFGHPLGLTESNVQLIIHYFGPQLKSLTLTDYDLSEQCLETIISECPNLQTLDVSGNSDITGECFQHLNNNLLTLRLSQCDSILESGLKAMVMSDAVNSLTELVISGLISDYMIKIICENMPQLKCLQCVYGCTRELDSQTDHLSVISKLKELERLSLQEIDAYFGSLDDKSLIKIITSCNHLKYLELHIGSGERLLVTDRSVALLANYCPLIECLKIYYFEAITDKSLNAFSKLKHLRELELINLYNITDEGVIIITEMCTQLTKLWISFDGISDSITNLTLIACIEMCRKRPKHMIEVNFFETLITVPHNLIIPMNMHLRVSWYRPTPEGRRYTEIKLPNKPILI